MVYNIKPLTSSVCMTCPFSTSRGRVSIAHPGTNRPVYVHSVVAHFHKLSHGFQRKDCLLSTLLSAIPSIYVHTFIATFCYFTLPIMSYLFADMFSPLYLSKSEHLHHFSMCRYWLYPRKSYLCKFSEGWLRCR